mgnify:CR=1 FL=1
MTSKIVAFILTLTLSLAAGTVVLLFLLIAMNGYSESDAMWGLGVYALLAFAVSVLMGFGAFLATGSLQKRQYGAFPSVLISVILFTVIGSIADGVCALIGVGVAEFVRVNF